MPRVSRTAVHIPRVLSIAGSDSGGGAGIQADLKAFARCGVHGMTAITAVTWQNTVTVAGVTPVPPEAIVGQVRAVAEDIGVDAVKIGMLGTAETVEAVAAALDLAPGVPVVLDPVMVAESGAPLLDADARESLLGLLPRATVVTPNMSEARAIVEQAGGDAGGDAPALARAIVALGPDYVVVTGGHAETDDLGDTQATGVGGTEHQTVTAVGQGEKELPHLVHGEDDGLSFWLFAVGDHDDNARPLQGDGVEEAEGTDDLIEQAPGEVLL